MAELESMSRCSTRYFSRRRVILAAALVGVPVLAGALAGTVWNRGPNPSRTATLTNSSRLGFDALDPLIAGSELIVVGQLTSITRQSGTKTGLSGVRADVSHENFVVEIQEVLKGESYVSASSLTIYHNTKGAVFLDSLPGGVYRSEDGPIDVREGATVVFFVSRSTNADGSRYWAIVGQPAVAEVGRDERLVFVASPTFVRLQAESGLKNAPGAGQAPFAATLSEVRRLAKDSLDPSVIDPPRDSVPHPRQTDVVPVKPGYSAP